jgi:outer membrane protein TolC
VGENWGQPLFSEAEKQVQSPLSPTAMTLDQATTYALDHSPVLATSQLDVAKAEAKIDEVLANFYPAIGLQGSFAYLSDVPVLKMPTGQPGAYYPVPLGSHSNYDAKLTLSQTLFSGGRISNGYKAARLGKEIAQDSIARKRQELVYSVRRSFNTILLTKELLSLTRQSRDRARDHLKVIIALREQGYASRYDSLRTAVQVENLAPQITRLEQGIALAHDAFKFVIGMPLVEEVAVTGKLEAPGSSISESAAVARALARRTELKQLDNGVKALRLLRNITLANYYPALGATAMYDLKKPSSMTGSGWGQNLTVALGLNFTLFDGLKTRAQLRQADLDIRKLQLMRDAARDGIVLEVREALTSMATAQATLDALKGNVVSAREGVKLAEARYTEGHSSNLDVLDAQLALFQAQVNVLTAIRDDDEAYARLTKAMGEEE